MMKLDDNKKTTTLGVVVFSFFGLVLYLLISALLGLALSMVVLKTGVPMEALKYGGLIINVLAIVSAVIFVQLNVSVKGIYTSIIMFALIGATKLIMGLVLSDGGGIWYYKLIGLMVVAVFSMTGSMLALKIKK